MRDKETYPFINKEKNMEKNFVEYNRNPLGLHESDCVCRAISLALNEDYYKVKEKLKAVATLFDCEELCVCCYYHLLDDVYNLENIYGYEGIRIKDFTKTHKKGVYIIRIKGHLTCVVDGLCYDSYNCTNELITHIWKVE